MEEEDGSSERVDVHVGVRQLAGIAGTTIEPNGLLQDHNTKTQPDSPAVHLPDFNTSLSDPPRAAATVKRQSTSSLSPGMPSKARKTWATSQASEAAMEVPKEPKIPPILMDMPKNWANHSSTINQLVARDFLATCTSRSVRLQTSTVAHFRSIQRYLQEQGIKFHTFALSTEKLLKVVIRGLPTTLSPSEVVEELRRLRFEASEAKILKTRGGRSTGLWLITLKSSADDHPKTEIYNLDRLYYCKVQVRKFTKPSGPIQCHRCQGFGHGSSHCHRAVRCVRCGDDHPGSMCSKEATAPARCCNCGGAHSANYRGCMAFKEVRKSTYAAAAATRPPARRVEPQRTPKPACPQVEAEDSVSGDHPDDGADPDGFETVKRRKRLPRNHANRGRTKPSKNNNARANTPEAVKLDTTASQEASVDGLGPRRVPCPRTAPPKQPQEAQSHLPQQSQESMPVARPQLRQEELGNLIDQLRCIVSLVSTLVEKMSCPCHG